MQGVTITVVAQVAEVLSATIFRVLSMCAGSSRKAQEVAYEYSDLLGYSHSMLVQGLVGNRTNFATFIAGCLVDLFDKRLAGLGRLSEVRPIPN